MFVDHIVQGEGEQAIVDIVEGNVRDRVVRYPRIRDLDALPEPAWDLFAKLPYNWEVPWFPENPVFNLTTSRGCPFNCAFCSNESVWGKKYTAFSAGRVVAEIEHLIANYGAKGIYFRENNFTANRKRVLEFCNLLLEKDIKIHWACESRVDSLDRNLLELMHKAGARGLYFGVESGSQRILDYVNKRITVDQIRNTFRMCHDIGIKTAASIVVGLPHETEEDLAATDKLLKEINPTMIWSNVFVGIPHSKLYRYVVDQHLFEFIDDRGLVYLKGHNERTRRYYQNAWDADVPFHPESPCVSVIMPAHNAGTYIEAAIQSILTQTHQDFELIVVNDGSTDDTKAILQQFHDPRINVIDNPIKLGQPKSRNIALESAKGKYIAVMDADDISIPHRLETQIRFLESNPDYALIGSYAYQIDESGSYQSIIILQTEDGVIRKSLIHGNHFVHGSVMVRRNVLREIGSYDERFDYAADYDLWLRIIDVYKVANLPEPLYCWRSSSTQISTAKKAEQDAFAEMARREARERAAAERELTERVCVEARTLVADGRVDDAWAILNRRIEGRPHDPLAHFYLGQLHEHRKERQQARACYEKAVGLEPENISYLKQLAGFLLLEEGDTAAALTMYDRVLHLAPADSETLLIRGNIAASKGQYGEAEQLYRRVLEVEPGNRNAEDNLETLSRLKQRDVRDMAPGDATPAATSPKTLETFKVTAIISAYNEGDVIYHVIGDLIQQGASVYLLDHRSTDNTVSEASKWLGKGLLHIETYPDDAHYAEENKTRYIWRDILKRKAELAAQLDADWFIHADADEFRESPWPGLTLREAIYIVDRLGYNAIDFELLNFRPVDNSFVPGKDVRQFLHHYEGCEDYNARQVKAWKNLHMPVDLVTSGGHDINFEGRRVFPIRFIHRHYPIRSQQHGLQKVFRQRKNRFCEAERSMAWHIQYDHILDESHNFIYDPAGLTLYNGEEVRTRLLTDGARQKKEDSPTLEILAAFGYDTDKSPRYLGNYERYFRPLINNPICILELGVFRGGSLYLWRDFFKHGTIVGLDANAVSIDDPTGRIRFYQGLQQDTDLLDRIRLECAPDGFDVIIDDASHVGELTRISFWHLFENHLKPGGIYVIEDWGTGYWDSFPDGKSFTPGENHHAGMVGFVKELVDECGMGDITHPQLGRNPKRDSRIERMEVCHGQIFIVKKVNRFGSPRAQSDAAQNLQGDVVDRHRPIHGQRQERAADALSHGNAAAFHYEKEDLAKAQSHFEKAVMLDPANPMHSKNLADFLYVAMKRPGDAIPHYEKALSLNPRDVETLLILGNIRAETGDFPQAREIYLRVLEIDPSNDLAGSMFEALEARAEDPGQRDPDTLVREARCLTRRGRTVRAVHLLEALLSACPDHAAAHNDLGNLYGLLQKPDEALRHLERAVQLAPEDTGFIRDLADAHLSMQADVRKAMELYTRSLQIRSDDVEILLRIGNLSAAVQAFDDAHFFYERAISIDPSNLHAQENLATLQRMIQSGALPCTPETDGNCQAVDSRLGPGSFSASECPLVSLRCFYEDGSIACVMTPELASDPAAAHSLIVAFDLSSHPDLSAIRLDWNSRVAVIKINRLLLTRKKRKPHDLSECIVTTGMSLGDSRYLFDGKQPPQIGFSQLSAKDLYDADRLLLQIEYADHSPQVTAECIREMRRLFASLKQCKERAASCFIRTPGERTLQTLPLQETQPGRIAVHLHLFYVDLTDRLLTFIARMPFRFDLYITVCEPGHIPFVERQARQHCGRLVDDLVVTAVPNRGRDIASLFHSLGERHTRYDYICHVHSKKSLRTGAEQTEWCDYLFESLFGDEKHLRRIFGLFAAHPAIGLIYPTTYDRMPYWCHSWLSNHGSSRELFNRLGIDFDTSRFIDYPVGSMFWARSQALAPLFNLGLRFEDFPAEPIPNDGTMCHAIERSFCISAVMQKLTFAEIDTIAGHYIVGSGKKNLWQYWKQSYDDLWQFLDGHRTVSFDVFDTLVTRPLIDPDHAFHIVQNRVARELNLNLDYCNLRKRAEALARSRLQCGRDVSLRDIYGCLCEIAGIPAETGDRIRSMEIENELRLAMPRDGMAELVARLRQAGKRVVFLSDMYLSSETLAEILTGQGIQVSREDILVSSETGMRKDTGEVWCHFRGRIADAHVGDNEHADIQMASDNGVPNYHVMSPGRIFQLSQPRLRSDRFHSFADSMYIGLSIARLFSSPFALHSSNGHVRFSDPHLLGYCVYGPVLLYFMTWLFKMTRKLDIQRLWFLSREGFLLKELFHLFSDGFSTGEVHSTYVYCSRRAVSVPMIKTDKDIRAILEVPYTGNLANLLKHRFGIHPTSMEHRSFAPDGLYDQSIRLPQQVETVLKDVLQWRDAILDQAKREKHAYCTYLNQLSLQMKNTTAVVDIGYAGTIQKYLRKMTSLDLLGLYFITNHKAQRNHFADKKMHACFGRYVAPAQGNCIYDYSLTLESVLTSPEGQLIRFEDDGSPVFEKNSHTESSWRAISTVHEGIKAYFRDALHRFGDMLLIHEPSIDAVTHFFRLMSTHPTIVSTSLQDVLRIDDYYVSNRTVHAFHYAHGIGQSTNAPLSDRAAAGDDNVVEETVGGGSSSHEKSKAARIADTEHVGSRLVASGGVARTADSSCGCHAVSIVILTFNELEYTKRCVESIRRHTPEAHEIVFVDNGSTDGTVKWLRMLVRENSRYRLIENKKNLGFAKGCNQGIESSTGEYVLLLNNDTVVTEGWLSGMLETLNSAPDIGIVGPMTNRISGIQEVEKVGYESLDGLAGYAGAFREKNRHRRIETRRIVGFCMLFRRTLVNRIGMLDESFGTGNFEDDDFCARAALAGYRNVIAGDVFIHHFGSRSFIGNRIDYGTTLTGNGRIYANKWRALEQTPEEGGTIRSLIARETAKAHFLRGDVKGGVDFCLEAIRYRPKDRRPYHELAGYLIQAGRFEEALEALKQSPAGATGAERFVLEGLCREGMKEPEAAASLADHAIAADASCAPAYNLKGVLAFGRGATEEAKTLFERAAQADPSWGEPVTNLGVLQWAAGEREAAFELLEKGFILTPVVSDLAERYHAAAVSIGALARAEKVFREARRLHPACRTIAFLLIDLLISQEKHAEAMQEIETALAAFEVDGGFIDAALEVRRQLGPMAIGDKTPRPTLSLCMIVRNEQPNLVRCLSSVKAAVDEIVIVDTGSTDRTKDLAAVFGARVFDFAWTDDFSSARNVSLSQAKGDWILVLDADETLSPRDHRKLREIIRKSPKRIGGYDLATRNYVMEANTAGWTANDGSYPAEEAGTGWYANRKVRLFRNDPRIRFSGAVHELVEASMLEAGMKIATCEIPVHHTGKLDRARVTEKGERYFELGMKKIAETGGTPRAVLELAVQAGELGRWDDAVDLWRRFRGGNPGREAVRACVNLINACLNADRFDEALSEARRAETLANGTRELLLNCAAAEFFAGDLRKAAAMAQRLLQKNPDYPPALGLLAMALALTGQEERGLNALHRLEQKGFKTRAQVMPAIDKLRTAGRGEQADRLLDLVDRHFPGADASRASAPDRPSDHDMRGLPR